MADVLVLGAGRIGRCIATLLQRELGFGVLVGDRNEAALAGLAEPVGGTVVDVRDLQQLSEKMRGFDAVVSACPFGVNPTIAQAALDAGISYFDLTEDVTTTRAVRELARSARPGQVFIPQCGLAPGFVGIVGSAMAKRFDRLDTLKLRVGALPELPSNLMLYNLTWSTEGLINEYCNPCEAIRGGLLTTVQALEGLETFSLGGAQFEAFNTSGGLGTLCETLQGRVRELTYKTVRYPGHRHLMDFLINGLRLGDPGERRELLERIFEEAVPVTDQDIVVIMVAATGYIDGKLVQKTEYHRVRNGCAFDPSWSAIQITTAAAACVAVDLFTRPGHDRTGFVGQEDIALEEFMSSPLAKPFVESAHLWRAEHGLD